MNLSRRGANHNTGTGDFFGNTTRPDGFPLPLGYDPVIDFGPLVKFPGSPSMPMANYDYTVDEADRLVGEGKLDLITFGRPFIYNPVSVLFIVHLRLHSDIMTGCHLSNPTWHTFCREQSRQQCSLRAVRGTKSKLQRLAHCCCCLDRFLRTVLVVLMATTYYQMVEALHELHIQSIWKGSRLSLVVGTHRGHSGMVIDSMFFYQNSNAQALCPCYK